MKISNKRELQQTVINLSSYIDFKDFMRSFKKCTAKPYSFSVNDHYHQIILYFYSKSFRKKIFIKHDHRWKDLKLQFDINREAAKISTIKSGNIDKCEYHTGEEILPSGPSKIIQQAKSTYSSLGKVFEN